MDRSDMAGGDGPPLLPDQIGGGLRQGPGFHPTHTPREVVVVDPERSYGLVFGHSRPLCPLGGVSCVSESPNPTRRVSVD